MREMSVAEQRYLAVLAVLAEGHDVSSVAQACPGRRCIPGWAGMRRQVWRVWSIGRTAGVVSASDAAGSMRSGPGGPARAERAWTGPGADGRMTG
jgi:hypothetical protein